MAEKILGNFPNKTESAIHNKRNHHHHSNHRHINNSDLILMKWKRRRTIYSTTIFLIVLQFFASLSNAEELASNLTTSVARGVTLVSPIDTSRNLLSSADLFLESISGLNSDIYHDDEDDKSHSHLRNKRSTYKRLKLRHIPPVSSHHEPSTNDVNGRTGSRQKFSSSSSSSSSSNLYSQPGPRGFASPIRPHLLPRILVPNFSVYLPIYGPSLYNINKIKLLPPIGPINEEPGYQKVSIPAPSIEPPSISDRIDRSDDIDDETSPIVPDNQNTVRFHTARISTSRKPGSLATGSLPVTASESINSDYKFQQPIANQVSGEIRTRNRPSSRAGFVNFKVARNVTTFVLPSGQELNKPRSRQRGPQVPSQLMLNVFSAMPPTVTSSTISRSRPKPTTPSPATKPYRIYKPSINLQNRKPGRTSRRPSSTTTTTTTTTTTPAPPPPPPPPPSRAPSTERVYVPVLTTPRPILELVYEPESFSPASQEAPTPSVIDYKREITNLNDSKFDNVDNSHEDDAAMYFDDFDNFDILRTETPKKRITNPTRRTNTNRYRTNSHSQQQSNVASERQVSSVPAWRQPQSSTSSPRTLPWQSASSWRGHQASTSRWVHSPSTTTTSTTTSTTTTTTTTPPPSRWNNQWNQVNSLVPVPRSVRPSATPAPAAQRQSSATAARTLTGSFMSDPLWATKPIPNRESKPVTRIRDGGNGHVHKVRNHNKSKKQDPLAAQHCTAQKCKLPNCNCGSSLIPGSLKTKDIPQLVMITFDDSINDLNWDIYREIFSDRYNPNGCPILGTFYVSHEWTDYSQVQTLYAAGHEMASHTITHSFGEKFSKEKWLNEVNGQREILHLYGGVKYEDVRGMRAPFLQSGGNNQYEMLHDANFTYDSSLPVHENNPPYWPYTFDYALNHECMIAPCPTRSFPGLWEFGMVMLIDYRGGRCSMVDACSHPSTENEVYENLLKNFYRHYQSNKAPFGLYFHSAWFNTGHYRKAFMRFLDEINRNKDVYFVTKWQALQWIQHPTPLQRIKSFKPFHCDYSDRKPCPRPKVCDAQFKDGPRYLKTCQKCPKTYPWVGKTGYHKKWSHFYCNYVQIRTKLDF